MTHREATPSEQQYVYDDLLSGKLAALLGSYDRPTDQPTNQPTVRRTVKGKLNFQQYRFLTNVVGFILFLQLNGPMKVRLFAAVKCKQFFLRSEERKIKQTSQEGEEGFG